MSRNTILIGFMGVGKGTVARALVKEFGYFAIDTDDIIESIENKKIKTIFKDSGEKYFRSLEQKTAYWCEQNITNTIISVGGGFYKVENLKNLGTIVYLESSFDEIHKRILNSPNAKNKLKKRPLFKTPKEAKKLYKERTPIYKELSDYIINVEGKSEIAIATAINEIIQKGR